MGEQNSATMTPRMNDANFNFRAARAAEQVREREAVRAFVEGVRLADIGRFGEGVRRLDTCGDWCWRRALRAVAAITDAPDTFRQQVLDAWVTWGDGFRDRARDDLLLADALRAVLPPYDGPARTLYRGTGMFERRRRLYGLSWTASREVAWSFGNGMYRTCDGGSVLLETQAPVGAIISTPTHYGDAYGEVEYLVDRRCLQGIRVLERYPQLSFDEYKLFESTLKGTVP
jgi:hypothetical protein